MSNDEKEDDVTCMYCGNPFDERVICTMCQYCICDSCNKFIPEGTEEYVHVDSREQVFLCRKCGVKKAQFYVPIL